MKLYAVTLQIHMNVVAEDEDAAVAVARRHTRDEELSSFDAVHTSLGRAPGWRDSEIPWCDTPRGNIHGTVGEWLRHSHESTTGNASKKGE